MLCRKCRRRGNGDRVGQIDVVGPDVQRAAVARGDENAAGAEASVPKPLASCKVPLPLKVMLVEAAGTGPKAASAGMFSVPPVMYVPPE